MIGKLRKRGLLVGEIDEGWSRGMAGTMLVRKCPYVIEYWVP